MKAGIALRSKRCLSTLCPKIVLCLALLSPCVSSAAAGYGPIGFLWSVTGNFQSVSNAFLNPVAIEMDLGGGMSSVYLGVAGDYWLGSREMPTGTETLNLLTAGVELGILKSYPRHFFLITAGVFYPLVANVTSTSGDSYVNASTWSPFSYRGRILVGIRITPKVSLSLGGGYRLLPLGNLAGAGGSINNGNTDLTGLVLSGGFTFTL